MSMGIHGEMLSTGETPDSSTTALWQSCQQSYVIAIQEKLGEGNDEFGLCKVVLFVLPK
jgi:hypothetical protein